MATVVTITYAADEAITVTTWHSLAADDWATSSMFDNTSNNYVDVLVGGGMSIAGTSWAAGDTWEVYVSARYDTDTVSYTGGIGTTFDASDSILTEDTEFIPTNLRLLDVGNVEATAPTTDQVYNWGPLSVAAAFGGILPQKFILVLHNNSAAGAMDSDEMVCNAVGITYTST